MDTIYGYEMRISQHARILAEAERRWRLLEEVRQAGLAEKQADARAELPMRRHVLRLGRLVIMW